MNDLGRTQESHLRRLALLEELSDGWSHPSDFGGQDRNGHKDFLSDLHHLVGRGLIEKMAWHHSWLYRRTARGSEYLAQEDPKER